VRENVRQQTPFRKNNHQLANSNNLIRAADAVCIKQQTEKGILTGFTRFSGLTGFLLQNMPVRQGLPVPARAARRSLIIFLAAVCGLPSAVF
jgi:hypothetical protein